VISGVEGVQPQTRILMRALERLRIPTLVFVNKIDRPGAGDDAVLQAISERLTRAAIPMGTAGALGTRNAYFALSSAEDAAFRRRLAEALAERDEGILAAYIEDDSDLPYRHLRDALAHQTMQALVQPVFFGSAITGAGVESLLSGISELLPAAAGDPDGPVAGTVFKIERGANGEKVAYVRMFSGTIHTRDRLRFGRDLEDKVTALAVFERGPAVQRPSVSAGAVAKLWGLSEVQVGDRIGETGIDSSDHRFSAPTMESVVVAGNRDDRARLRVALTQLAEQDPLIDVRQDDTRQELSVSLYGEVQKEVIQATLQSEFGLEVTFRKTTPIYIERPIGSGAAIEILHAETNPFLATIGLRVDPAPDGSGIDFRLQVDPRTVPLYIYKTMGGFSERMDHYVRSALQEGLSGWQVTDCTVTMTKCVYSVPDGPPSKRGPLSTAADFRKLTPLVLMQALERAETVVCEPIVRATVETPTSAIGAVMAALARLDAAVETPSLKGTLSTIETVLPAARAQDLQQQLPGLTGGEGVLDSSFAGYQPVSGDQPSRKGGRGESAQP
jgi:ribosomal protection tetracycline resistance protein